MRDKKPTELTERINHKTESRPFSIHHTVVPPYMDLVLYLHCHREMEFFYLEQGEVIFQVEDSSYNLKAGDAIFIPSSLMHSTIRYGAPDASCSFYAIVFSREMLMDIIPSYCEHYIHPVMYNSISCIIPLYQDISWHSQVLYFLNIIFTKHNSDIELCELMLRGSLLIIWQLLYNNQFSQILSDYTLHTSQQIKNSVDYIKENYMENILLSELAHNAGLSEGHFCKLFKVFTGFTPFNYLNRRRISKSCEYLIQTNKKIAEIAVLCGYNNISYYNRAFQKLIKESPSSYRRHFSIENF